MWLLCLRDTLTSFIILFFSALSIFSFSSSYGSSYKVNFIPDDVIHYMDTRNDWYIYDNYLNSEGGKYVNNFRVYIKTPEGVEQVRIGLQTLQKTFDLMKEHEKEGKIPYFYSDDDYKKNSSLYQVTH